MTVNVLSPDRLPAVLDEDPSRRTVLQNGLRVVTVELPHLHSGMVAVYVRAGSRHEDARTNGVSHFLEHLFFRGSKGYPDGRAMNAMVEDVGGDLNGVTTRDHGYYYTPVHPGRLDVPLTVLGDMLARPLLKDVELEREVILEEILDEVDENGRDIDIDNLSKRALFGEHALGFKIGGTRETVSGLAMDDLRSHHLRAYGGRNLVLCCAGPIRHDEVLRVAERAFGHLPPGALLLDTRPQLPERTAPEIVCVEHRGDSQTSVQVSFPGPPEDHADFPVLRVIKRILSDGLASRLQLELVEKKALAYSVGAGMDGYSDCSVFDVGASCAPRKAATVLEEIFRLLAGLCEGDATDEEIERAKLKSRIGLEFMLDSPADMLGWYGTGELIRPPVESFGEWLARMEAVTKADVQRVARQVFRRSRLVSCAVGPLGASEKRLRALSEEAPGLPK